MIKEQLNKCIQEGMTMVDAAKHLEVSKSSIQRLCKKWNLSFNRVGRVSQEYLDTITENKIYDALYRNLSIDQAAKEFKISRTAFTNRLAKLGISFRKFKFNPKKYMLLKSQGLIDKEIMKIFDMSESGMRFAKDLYGIEKQKRNYKQIPKNKIKELYLNKKLSILDISEELDKSVTNIYDLLKRYNVKLRREDGINISKENLAKYYIAEGLSIEELAVKFRTTADGVKLALIRHGLDTGVLYSEENSSPLNRLNDFQEQLIYGSLLGDGHLEYTHSNVLLKTAHSSKQKEYVLYKYFIMMNFSQKSGMQEVSRYDPRTKKMYHTCSFKTVQSKIFTDIYSLFYDTQKVKFVSQEVLDKLDGRGLSFWFMDDGFKYNNYGLGLCTDSFSEEGTLRIVHYFKKKWDIETTINRDNRIIFKRKNALLFQRIIAPHIIPQFQYKLIESRYKEVLEKELLL